jgi:16S rRNA processing protein RimM
VADERLDVGYVRKAHGLTGRVVVRPMTDAPELRFAAGSRLGTNEDPPRRLDVVSSQPHAGGLVVQFVGIDDRDEAEALRGVTLSIRADERRQLEEGEYWPDELVGCAVVDASGDVLGTVAGIAVGAAQDRLVVVTEGDDEVEVPFVEAIVVDVDLVARQLVVDPPGGLFPE